MSSRNQRFNFAMGSMDSAAKQKVNHDQMVMMYGRYVSPEGMYAALDGMTPERLAQRRDDAYDKALYAARQKLRRLGKGYLIPTLNQIVRYHNNRAESIRVLQAKCKGGNRSQRYARARQMYYRHRDELVAIFCSEEMN